MDLFPPVRTLIIEGELDPTGQDMLSPESMSQLRHLTIEKTNPDSDKAAKIVSSLSHAQHLQSFSLDLQGLQPMRILEILFTTKCELQSLKLKNLSTEMIGLAFFKELPSMLNLKELELNFQRLRDADIKRNKQNVIFSPGSCPSVEKLVMSFSASGKLTTISDPLWIDLLRMFSGVKNLTISCAGSSDQATFW